MNPSVHATAAVLSHVRHCSPMDCSLPGSSVHGIFPGKNTGVGCHSLLQGLFPNQGSNLHLLHWQADSLPLASPGNLPVFIVALFTTAKLWKQHKCPSADKWIKKMWCIYTMEYYSAIKKNGVWIDLEGIMLSEISQTEKDKYYIISLICRI